MLAEPVLFDLCYVPPEFADILDTMYPVGSCSAALQRRKLATDNHRHIATKTNPFAEPLTCSQGRRPCEQRVAGRAAGCEIAGPLLSPN